MMSEVNNDGVTKVLDDCQGVVRNNNNDVGTDNVLQTCVVNLTNVKIVAPTLQVEELREDYDGTFSSGSNVSEEESLVNHKNSTVQVL